MSDTFNTTPSNWQGIDDEPTAGSKNLVTSGGVYLKINQEKQRAESVEQNLQGNIDVIKEETLEENREMVNSIMQNYAPVEIIGDVNNAPDEEDLTSVNVEGTDVLKFKDKVYNPLVYSGLGRKILRKNIVDGVNVLTQEMMPLETGQNTIYVIQYDFTLGEDITVPANCVLEFDGGSLKNGTVVGSDTKINYSGPIFTDINIDGTWNVPYIDAVMLSDVTSTNKILELFKLCSSSIHNDVYIGQGNYSVMAVPADALDRPAVINLNKKDTSVVIDGHIVLEANALRGYNIIRISADNISVSGSGTIEGDALTHDYYSLLEAIGTSVVISTSTENTPAGKRLWVNGEYVVGTLPASQDNLDVFYLVANGLEGPTPYDSYYCRLKDGAYSYNTGNTQEWGHAIGVVSNVNNIKIDGLKLKYCTGDGITIGNNSVNVMISNIDMSYCRRQGISIHTNDTILENFDISNIGDFNVDGVYVKGTDPKYAIDIEPDSGHYSRNIRIVNGKIDSYLGILTANPNTLASKNVIIENIYFTNCSLAITLYAIQNVLIHNCISDSLTSISIDNANESDVQGKESDFISIDGFQNAQLVTGVFEKKAIEVRNSTVNVDKVRCRVTYINCNIDCINLIPYQASETPYPVDNTLFLNCLIKSIRTATANERPILMEPSSLTGIDVCYYQNFIFKGCTIEFLSTTRQWIVDISVKNARITFEDCHFIYPSTNAAMNKIFRSTPDESGRIVLTNCTNSGNKPWTIYSEKNSRAFVINGIRYLPNAYASNIPATKDLNPNDIFVSVNSRRMTINTYSANQNNFDLYDTFGKLLNVQAAGALSVVQRIVASSIYQGFQFFATDLKKPIIAHIDDEVITWRESDGAVAGVLRQGTTANRPVGSSIYVGFMYFDTSISPARPIYASSISGDTVTWVDATGATV
jgi:hypothetical protein